MAWLVLLLASVCEILWAVGLKYSEGLTRWWPSVLTVVFMLASFVFLAQAVKQLPLGTAYAVWTGIGAVGSVAAGIVLFGESASLLRVACVLLIVTGMVGLKLSTS